MAPTSDKRWFSWKRLACLVSTAAALWIIFQRIDVAAFRSAMGTMQPGWFLLSILLYGTAILFGAWRWHLALRLTGVAVHTSASARLFCIGHYFFVILFGGLAGDIAKSTVYARWYQRSFPEVLAASPIDRAMGLGGLLVFGVMSLCWAMANQSLAHLQKLDLAWPGVWVLLVMLLVAGAVTLLVFRPPRHDHPGARLLRAIRSGGARLIRNPFLAAKGLGCGLIVQAALSGVLAANLQAVSQHSLPWSAVLWTFPVISLLSSLPVTVAGLGVREGASILLLGPYGIPASDAVAAGLLTLGTALVWALVGGALLWWEERQRRKCATTSPRTISIIVPALNEVSALPETVRRVRQIPEVSELIVVDGGSTDGTLELATELGCRVLSSGGGRGGQLRCGAAHATGDVVLLLHADTWLPADAGQAVLNCLRDPLVVAGGFWKVFRQRISPLLLGSRWKCAIRLYIGRRIAGDQAIFVRREVLEAIGGVPDLPLMEEFELCRRLHRVGRLALADTTIVTSARRFAKFGVLRTYLRMWYVTTRYRLGTSPQVLRRIYDRE